MKTVNLIVRWEKERKEHPITLSKDDNFVLSQLDHYISHYGELFEAQGYHLSTHRYPSISSGVFGDRFCKMFTDGFLVFKQDNLPPVRVRLELRTKENKFFRWSL